MDAIDLGSAQPSARTNESASSASSAGTPVTPLSIRPTSPPSAGYIYEFKVDRDKLIELVLEDKRNNSSSYALVLLSQGAEWEGSWCRNTARPTPLATAKRPTSPKCSTNTFRKRGEETIVSDLTYDLRSGAPDFVDRMVANTFGGMAIDIIRQGGKGVMTAIQQRQVCSRADSRPEARTARRRRCQNVRQGALPPQLHRQDGSAGLPDACLKPASPPGRHPDENPRFSKVSWLSQKSYSGCSGATP